ncbi:thiopeptide-type bacteriocin biosynthesis protein [Kitasatospora sp. MAP5-34]|uniref:thiopeptide-type bacteriocin biosynthesis protein n=1 Tax=Kitasatospora sp. MAP5-34 TaxID=3035102 RepID=UPI002473D29D|nr:thiopeptide-type bacteriocin biosynthesis protein [Kitasatospora sp. MAP5-34]MDH6574910.1 thiopeptide-type bacteriocin biosynthesis protein [Kitasatospora sp. MAP5-34]
MALTPAPVAPTPVSAAPWSSVHCFLRWRPEHTDAFVTGTLAPLMEALCAAGRIEGWFFVRYSEHGHHLRIRALGADPATTKELCEQLAEAVRAAPYSVEPADRGAAGGPEAPRGHGEVCESRYEPETERYGGAAALPIAEEVFCRSSAIATAAVARTPEPARRLAAATDFILATAIALDLDPLGTVRWLRRGAIAWRRHPDATALAPTTVQGSALEVAAAQSAAVVRRWHDIHASDGSGTRLRDQWAACVRTARARLEPDAEADTEADRERWLQVWSSQLHMLLNRMGVLPDEERSLQWFIASSLLAPEGTTDFFADHPAAVDRRYLDASNFAPSRMEWQQPRNAPRAPQQPPRSPFAGPPVALPAGAPPSMPLAEAMTRRSSARGELGPDLRAEELGTLLWSAHAGQAEADAHGRVPRPYPSAGASYAARLRLIVREVEGLSPGTYELDPVSRTMLPIGAAPTTDELAAAYVGFGRQALPGQYLDVSAVPALVGLYVDLGALRERYGLRALRFAFLEAGHLAQNLALTAAATRLSLVTVGGFYDDVAHELFMLDGVDEVLAYLLPVSRRRSE